MSEVQYARILTKASSGIATIPPSADHSNGDWISTDIYEHELYIDDATGKLYTNIGGVITELNPDAPASLNLGNSDLQLTGNRLLDFDSNTMGWSNIKEFIAEATTLPSIGNSSFDFKAFGKTGADINFRIGNQSGDTTTWYGDGKVQHDGYFEVNDTSGIDVEHRFSSNGANTYFIINSTTYSQLHLQSSNSFVWSMQTVGTGAVIERINNVRQTRDVANNVIAGYENLNTASAANYEVLPTLVGSTGAPDSSAILEARSTNKGVLGTRMTEAQMNAIASPAVGLEVFNTTRSAKMVYHAVFGWVGVSEKSLSIQAGVFTLSPGSNWYFGNIPTNPQTVIANRQFKSPYDGKITKANIRLFSTGSAGDRSISVYIRIDNTTDYLVATINDTNPNREFINSALNTNGIPVTTSSDIVCKVVASGGTTNATNVVIGGYLTIQ